MPSHGHPQHDIDKQRWIRDWVSSLEDRAPSPPQPSRPKTRRLSESNQVGERPLKRVRTSRTQQLETPPPESMSQASGSRKRSRTADTGQGAGEDFTTPRPNKSSKVKTPSRSSVRRRPAGTSKLKLVALDKPVRDEAVQSTNPLPPDVCDLDAMLQDPSRGANDVADDDARLGELLEIVLDAREGARTVSHECQWNHQVHTQILRLVFKSRCLTEVEGKELKAKKQRARARWVPAMTATISGEYIPRRRRRKMPKSAIDDMSMSTGSPSRSSTHESLACSVSADSQRQAEDNEEGEEEDLSLTEVHSRSDSKKVDYVVAADAAPGTPLHEWLEYLSTAGVYEDDDLPHVNQTKLGSLAESPIACSIETKVQSATDDGLNQLGLWVAAWHRKMESMRDFLAEQRNKRPNVHQRIPSALVIKAVNDEWDLYYVGDEGSSITLRGPVRIGSTINLAQARTLLRSLDIIREWVQTSFAEAMERWLIW